MIDKKRILSFDIETSSLDPRSGFVWQSGFASFDGNSIQENGEYFRPDDTSDAGEIEKRLTTSKFGQEQHKAGTFTEYLNGSSTHDNQDGFIRSVADKLIEAHKAGKNILLIQNANFERKWIEAVGSASETGQKALSDLSTIFHHSYVDRGTGLTMPAIYPSPDILQLRNEALDDYYSFLKTGNNASFDSAAASYEKIMQSYLTNMDSVSGHLVPVDMMDISRGVLFKAAQSGLIDKNMSLIGTSQHFLSMMLLGRPESHLAPDDGGRALEIAFDKLLPVYGELHSGNISDETKTLFQKIKMAQPAEASNQFGKSLVRALEEGSSQYGYRMLGAVGTSNPEEINFTNNITGETETATRKYRVARYHLHTDKDLDLIINDVSSRYHNITMSGNTAQEVEQKLIADKPHAEKIANIEAVAEELKKGTAAPSIPEAVESNSKLFNWIKNNKGKTAIGALAGIGILGVMASSDKDAKTIRSERIERRRLNNSVDSNLQLYAMPNIQPPHGSGFADWNERTKHHYY